MRFLLQRFFFLFIMFIIQLRFFAFSQSNSDSTSLKNRSYRVADKPFYTISGHSVNETTKIKPIPTAIFTGTYTGIFILQHIGQMNTIWQNRGNFHFAEDGKYALYIDKTGHFYGTFLTSYVLSQSLIECGFSYNWATGIGGLLGLGYTTYVEILDGFATDWGFSPSDFYADVGGALFFYLYSYVPFFQNFTPKFMYFPPRWFNAYSRKPSKMFIDDYSSHTFWININIHNLLPNDWKKHYPKWLDLSIGVAVRNLCDPLNPSNNCNPQISEPIYSYVWGNPKLIIALDYDLVKLLPDGAPFWNWLKQSLNFFKLPSPALEIGHPTRFYLLYPFPLKLGSLKF
ncbi:DUF2279 domain-containing protein [Bacteroidetes/Chlorobi group bacterium Naka2016]|nr:MAG: DUF2279 domain-containing protein [Bacteroidetes/Chlorobi group bacterium Naka2016]